ncbi:MAG: NUDIX hydrolase [Actinomycetota bacterium]
MTPGGPEPLDARTVWRGRFLTVDVEDWPQTGAYELIHKHDAVAVVPVTPERDVLLVRQFRPPVRDSLLEVPAGLLDVDGEDPVACAAREVVEETGYRHRTIEFLGGCYLSPGFTDEYMHLFWAEMEPEPVGMPETGIELVRMPFAHAVEAARGGRVRNAASALALLLAADRVPRG